MRTNIWSNPLSETIQTPTEAPVEPDIAQHDPQGSVREAIAARYEEQRLREMEDAAAEPAPVEPEPVAAEPADEPIAVVEPAPEPVAAPATTPAATPDPAQLFPIQLPNGSVTYATAAQMVQLAGLGAAAVLQPPPQAAPRAAEPAPPAPTHPTAFDGEKARAIHRRVAYGSEEEGAAALQELVQSAMQPTVDVATIRADAAREALAQIKLEQNLQTIGTEFPEIFNNRVLAQAAALQLHELRGHPAAQNYSDLDLYRVACNTVKQAFNLPQSAPRPQDQGSSPAIQAAPGASQTRLERKRAAPSTPVATDRRLGAGDDATRVPTNSEVIDQIRKSRGQAPLR